MEEKTKVKSKATSKKSKTASKAKPKTVLKAKTSTSKAKKSRKKGNLLKLYSEMNKLAVDAVDKEILKRFKIIIDTSDDDITKASLQIILKEPKNVDLHSYHESFQPYIKHYIFMLKRERNRPVLK